MLFLLRILGKVREVLIALERDDSLVDQVDRAGHIVLVDRLDGRVHISEGE